MDRPPPPATDLFPDVLAWIEQQLDRPLTLEQVAARAGLSPCHFSRLFTARMGRSVIAHVRGRRLVRGARRLGDEPDLRLVDLALDCGFESLKKQNDFPVRAELVEALVACQQSFDRLRTNGWYRSFFANAGGRQALGMLKRSSPVPSSACSASRRAASAADSPSNPSKTNFQ